MMIANMWTERDAIITIVVVVVTLVLMGVIIVWGLW